MNSWRNYGTLDPRVKAIVSVDEQPALRCSLRAANPKRFC